MRTLLKILVPLLFFGGLVWVFYGQGLGSLPVRVASFVGALVVICFVVCLATVQARRGRRARNEAHCERLGYRFSVQPKLEDVAPVGNLFQRDGVRLEQLTTGQWRGVDFEVFDLAYTVTHQSDNGSSTTVVEQTVAILRGLGLDGVALSVGPERGLGGGVARFLGLRASIAVVREGLTDEEQLLVRWFERNYTVSVGDDTSGPRAESKFHPALLRWLRDRAGLAFELAGGHLVVWRKHRLVDSGDRDALVEEGVQLAKLLHSASPKEPPLAIRIDRPAIISANHLVLLFMVSAFISWGIALVLGMTCFVGVIALGWAERTPLASLVGIMAIVVITWVSSGLIIFRYVSRFRRRSGSN